LSRAHFAGLRNAALARDGRACTVCGTPLDILVHHRRPGVNELRWLVTSCRRCHPRIHFLERLPYGVSPHFRRLWRELHRDEIEQLELPFFAPDPAVQAGLF
jgi:5-methylcytosine-specific restriction endonuclease McrA